MNIESSKQYRQRLEKRTWEIVRSMQSSCEFGGCHNHVEPCGKSEAWDYAEEQAREELWNLYEEAFL